MSNYDLNLFYEYQKTNQILEAASRLILFLCDKNRYIHAVVHFKFVENIEQEMSISRS